MSPPKLKTSTLMACRKTSKCKWFFKCSWRMTDLPCRWTRYSLLDVLIIRFLAFYFQLQIYSTCCCKRIMKHFILEIILSLKSGFEVLTDATLGVILYPEVVLNKQISTFTITEIFLRISNLQHISPKL